jgi:heme O synthase-like polyprenyltransferase
MGGAGAASAVFAGATGVGGATAAGAAAVIDRGADPDADAVLEAATARVPVGSGSLMVAGFFSCMSAATTGVPTDATGAL